MNAFRKLLLLLVLLGGTTAAGCSAEADVDSGEDGDGIQIEGDVDETEK